jgi:hypothetical protein
MPCAEQASLCVASLLEDHRLQHSAFLLLQHHVVAPWPLASPRIANLFPFETPSTTQSSTNPTKTTSPSRDTPPNATPAHTAGARPRNTFAKAPSRTKHNRRVRTGERAPRLWQASPPHRPTGHRDGDGEIARPIGIEAVSCLRFGAHSLGRRPFKCRRAGPHVPWRRHGGGRDFPGCAFVGVAPLEVDP